MKTKRKYNPVLTVTNNGQFYDVEYNVFEGSPETISFRTYKEATEFFNTIPLR